MTAKTSIWAAILSVGILISPTTSSADSWWGAFRSSTATTAEDAAIWLRESRGVAALRNGGHYVREAVVGKYRGSAVDRWVAHSSYNLIGQKNGRYVAGTLQKSLALGSQRSLTALKANPSTRITGKFVIKQAAKRAVPYAVATGVGVTAPAWGTAAAVGAAAIGLGYSAYELYDYAIERY